jgi:excisionase family DNA binding protein
MPDDDLLTVAQVAKLLKLSTQTIYNRVRDGSLAHTRVGRVVRIRREDLEALGAAVGATSTEADLLTVAEVAGLLQLNVQTVRNWIIAGKLPAVHVGRRVRIMRSELDAILEAGESGGSEVQPSAEDFWQVRRLSARRWPRADPVVRFSLFFNVVSTNVAGQGRHELAALPKSSGIPVKPDAYRAPEKRRQEPRSPVSQGLVNQTSGS